MRNGKVKPPKITAGMLLDLLATRHQKAVFVPECKDGASYDRTCLRMDAWAMARSWAKPHIFGYEIKVSRSDFLSDDKWRGYLPNCNSFSFVTAPGVIKEGELPEDTGWLVSSSTGGCLLTKRKAPYRDVRIPEDVWRYVLMCRSKITGDSGVECDREFWRQWLEGRRDDDLMGRRVSRKLRAVISEKIEDVQKTNKQLQRDINTLQDIRKMLMGLGYDPANGVPDEWTVERKIERKRNQMSRPDETRISASLGHAKAFLEQAIERLSEASGQSWDGE